ncbi:hypothetical protein KY289_016751 [Solanum tuberosum]|nr:hypothetical protein KY289_016751 [Solanum tuberosum]
MEAEYYPPKEDVILHNSLRSISKFICWEQLLELIEFVFRVINQLCILLQDLLVDIDGREQNLQGFGGFDIVDKESDPSLVFNNCSHVSKQDTPTNPSNLISINIQTLEAETKKQVENETECCGREHQIVLDHSVVPRGHIEMAPSLSERRWKEDQLDTERGGNKSIHEVLCCSYSGNRSQTGANGGKSIKKRVTIHMRNNINLLQEQNGKVIILPDRLEELFILVTTRRTDNDS